MAGLSPVQEEARAWLLSQPDVIVCERHGGALTTLTACAMRLTAVEFGSKGNRRFTVAQIRSRMRLANCKGCEYAPIVIELARGMRGQEELETECPKQQ